MMKRHGTRLLLAVAAALALLAARPAAAENAPININTASAAELSEIKGIGAAKAQAIVDHRQTNGEFKSVDDLKLVRGIGDKMLEQLRPQLTVGSTAPAGVGAAKPVTK
jgi:competence protein ComEA